MRFCHGGQILEQFHLFLHDAFVYSGGSTARHAGGQAGGGREGKGGACAVETGEAHQETRNVARRTADLRYLFTSEEMAKQVKSPSDRVQYGKQFRSLICSKQADATVETHHSISFFPRSQYHVTGITRSLN